MKRCDNPERRGYVGRHATLRASKSRQECHKLVLETYRAAFSAAANIVEGSAKHGAREYRRFFDISIGSLAELGYAFRVARELEMLSSAHWLTLEDLRRRAGFLT